MPSSVEINEPPTKRQKTSSNVADELICPITLELPYDPVTASDGRIYERSAIEKHIERCIKDKIPIKSPITNVPIDKRYLPSSPQTKNLIEKLIETKAITGELANNWKKKDDRKKKVEMHKKRAEDGDTDAMYKVGQAYFFGKYGYEKDMDIAYQWFKKGADKMHVKSMALAGVYLVMGGGVKKNLSQGMLLIGMAANAGSNFACEKLADWYRRGNKGLPKDTEQAIYWYKKALDPAIDDNSLTNKGKDGAREQLRILEAEIESSTQTF